MTAAMELPPLRHRVDSRAASTALLLAAVFFASIFPTLRWQEFSNTSEGLNVATALEIRRTGNWLVPTLEGQTRLAKPPLPAWLTAVAIPGETFEAISSADREARVPGQASLATIVRAVALLCATGTLLATFAMGKLLFSDDVGLVALIIVGTSLLMMRFCRVSNTDIHLTLWVTVTNALLCLAVIRRQWAYGLIGAGIALALAMMSKGPVCLAQTIVPMGVFAFTAPRRMLPPSRYMLAGGIVFAVIGLAWYVLVIARVPHALQLWAGELSGHPDQEKNRTSIFTYLLLIPYMTPWIAFFAASIVLAVRRRDLRDRLLLLLIFVPIVIMSISPDRYDRYLLPMIPACAILTARLMVVHVQKLTWNRWDLLTNSLHWLVVAGIGVGLPISGHYAKELKTYSNQPWWSAATAWQSAAFVAVIIVIAILLQRRTPTMLILATALLMLGLQSLFMTGYVKSEPARSEFRPVAESVWSQAPNLRLFHTDPEKSRRAPIDLSIYLNRADPLVTGFDDIPPGQGPAGLLIMQKKDDPEPPAVPGWTRSNSKPRGKDRWWLFIQNVASLSSEGKIPIP